MQTVDSHILDIAARLSDAATLGPHEVATAVDAKLVIAPDRSTAYFDVFVGHGDARSFAAEVEMRVPREGTKAKGPFVFITLRTPSSLDASQVIARFGEPTSLRVPAPQAAAAAAAIYAYRRAIGTLRFAVGPAPAQEVRSIAIDQTA